MVTFNFTINWCVIYWEKSRFVNCQNFSNFEAIRPGYRYYRDFGYYLCSNSITVFTGGRLGVVLRLGTLVMNDLPLKKCAISHGH